jgi:CheY-like chemotaxis protein
VEIRVADDGTGMPSEIQGRIFEPFFTTKSADEGTGLGLAMVRTFVERSGGAICVESAPGEGTRFTLRFPVTGQAGTGRPGDSRGTPQRSPAPPPRVVLLVENDELVRRSAERILEDAGHRVIAACSAADAALALCEHSLDEIDVVVTDIVMPGMSGTELADVLTQRRPEISVVLMSGHADPDQSALDSRRHELNVLAKPFTPESLLERVERSRPAGARGVD